MNCSFKNAAMAVKTFFLMTSNLLVIVCLLYVTQEDFPTSHFQFHKIQSWDTLGLNKYHLSAENKELAHCIIPSMLLTCYSIYET